MIKVVAKNLIKEDKLEEVLKLCEELINETRKEDGCISYELYQDENDKRVLTMIETWQGKKDLDKHLKSPHFERIAPMFVSMLEKETEMNVYTKVM